MMAASRTADDPVVMTREGYNNLKKELSSQGIAVI